MTGLALLSLIGVAVALVCGGSLSGWARARVWWGPVALASLGVQLALHNPPIDHQPWAIVFGPLVWMACVVALLATLVRNALASGSKRGPWLVAAVGVGLNLLVVVSNGGYMPQSAEARAATKGTPSVVTESRDTKLSNVRPMDDQTRLGLLGDVIAEPSWLPNANVMSVGDLFLGSGMAWWAFAITKRRRIA